MRRCRTVFYFPLQFVYSVSIFVFTVPTKDLPPRFKKILSHTTTGGPGNSDGEVSLRPAPSSMMLKPKTPGILPQSALGNQQSSDHHHSGLPLTPQPQPPNQKPAPPLLHKDPPILIKQASTDKGRDKKKDKVSLQGYLGELTSLFSQNNCQTQIINLLMPIPYSLSFFKAAAKCFHSFLFSRYLFSIL